MNKKIVIVTAIAAVGTIAYAISMLGSEGALMKQFPDVPQKIVTKVHRKMFRDALMGRLGANLTDDQLNEIFLARVREYVASQ